MGQLLFFAFFMHICFHNITAGNGQTRTLMYETYILMYVPDHMQREEARRECEQRSGSLVSNPTENQEFARVLKCLNISQEVWIACKHLTGSPKTLALDFCGRSNSKHARLLHKFPPMGSVTVCTRLRFDSETFGLSTVFSYSIQSCANEFQLRAQVIRGESVHLALLVHGTQGPYKKAFDHDDSWHSVCVSWGQNGGHWAIYAHDYVVGQGDGLNSTDSIGPDGLFVIGQEQETFGGPFKSNESFSGSVTELHIWDRVLGSSEIFTMEKKCSPVSSGLVFKWSEAAMEIENSLTKLLTERPCQENSSLFLNTVVDSLGNESSLDRQTLSFFHIPSHKVCGIFDPVNETVTFADCSVFRLNDTLDISKPPFINRFNKDPQIKLVKEGTHFNSFCNIDLTSLQLQTQTVLDSMKDRSPHLLTSSNVLALSQMIDAITSSSHLAADVMVSITTNYVNAASWMLEPQMAAQWIGPTADGVNVGPFTIVKSIDSLTKALADTLFAQQRDFTLSTKNIEVYIKWQKLSQMSSDQVFKPSSVGSHHPKSGRRDELLIPDSELKRIHSLGSEEVMFIHTHYSHFSEVFNRVEEPELHQQENIEKSVFPGHLSSSVISAAVRDSLKAQTIPVIVQYTLSSHVVENSQRFLPDCAFWNFSLMYGGGWSSQGCSVVFIGSNVVSCLCNHTTNFAVLMNYMNTEWNPEEELVLSKLTFIGCGASLCALVVTLMLFTVLDIPKSDRTSIHKNLFVALICAQVILLCSGSAIHSKVACTLVAALLHLFFLAAFSWMLVEGLLLWSKVVAVNLNEDRHMKYYYLIGWGLPVLIVTITLASASGKYAADDYCWLSVQNGIIWGFAGPVIFIIMVNIFVLTRVVIITVSTARRRSIMLAMGASPVNQAYEQIRGAVKAVLVLLPILGLTWLCGVLVPLSIVMAYIFILLNSLQGLFIFLIYGVYNTEVRSTVNRMKERRKALNFSNFASSRPSSSVTNSRPVSFPLGTTPSQEEETCPCGSTPSLVIEDNKTTGEPTIQCVPVRPEESWGQTP